jgi:type II secretory pathway pseudopilin PulG
MVELAVVCMIICIIAAIAVIQLLPSWHTAQSDDALRLVLDQLRQAREYSIANRRYVQVSFPTVGGQAEVVITQWNTLTPGGGATNPVLSTTYVEGPLQYALVTGMPDTPDQFNTPSVGSSPVQFKIEGTSTVPVGNMLFQSDGELIDSVTNLPIDGTISIALAGNASSARAVTVMGATGRVHGWRSTGASWIQF